MPSLVTMQPDGTRQPGRTAMQQQIRYKVLDANRPTVDINRGSRD